MPINPFRRLPHLLGFTRDPFGELNGLLSDVSFGRLAFWNTAC
jgi:hypothetical protein